MSEPITIQQLINAGIDAETASEFLESFNDTLTTRKGSVKKTLTGIDNEAQSRISDAIINSLDKSYVGTWQAGTTTFNTFNDYAEFNSQTYKPRNQSGITLPYVAQGADPTQLPDSEFIQPFSDIDTIGATQLITEISYIVYKASGGNSAIENMIAGVPIASEVGDVVSSGGTTWIRTNNAGGLSDFEVVNELHLSDYESLVSGGIWDDAIHQLISDYQSRQTQTNGMSMIKFPAKTVRIKSVQINDLYDTLIDFNGCMLLAVADTPTTAAFTITNYNNIKLGNMGALYSFNNTNYTYGMLLNGGPGGSIDPSKGLGKELTFFNSLILRFARGLKIGNESLDVNHGQNTLSDVHIKECNQGLIAAGAQTIVSVSGGTLGSGGQDIYGIPDNEKIAVLTYGATVTINSTEALKASGDGYGFGVTNSLSPVYDYQYGMIVINGAYIETTSIARIFSVGSGITRSSLKSALIMSNVTGGVSGANNISIVCNADDYAGLLSLNDGNIYGFGGARTVPAIDGGNSDMFIDLGRRFFRTPFFKSNLEEVVGGSLALGNDLIFRSENLASQTITPTGDNIKFQSIYSQGRFSRYSGIYSSATGELTVPKGGFSQLKLEVGVSSVPFSGVVRVQVNGVTRYNFYTNLRLDISATLYDLAENDKINVRIEPNTNVTFGSLAQDYMQLVATL